MLQGLSPDHATMLAAGSSNRCRQSVRREPMTVEEGTSGGNFCRSPGAVASIAAGDHSRVRMSIRFMPEPSAWSMGACVPVSTDARKELVRYVREEGTYAS